MTGATPPTETATGTHGGDPPAEHKVSRRTMLRWAGLGTGGLLLAIGGGVGIRAASNGVWAAGALDAHELWRSWRSERSIRGVVSAAVLAASPHNTQPWLFDLHDDHIDVLSHPERFIPITDPYRREHYAGLGCAVENMARAAGALGFVASLSVEPEGAESPVVARVALAPDAHATADPLFGAIGRSLNLLKSTTESGCGGSLTPTSAKRCRR